MGAARRLTDDDRRRVADYLAAYPHPVALLVSAWPATYRALRLHFSRDEIESLCFEGVVKGFLRHDPDRGQLSTAIAWSIRGVAIDELRRHRAVVIDGALVESQLRKKALEDRFPNHWPDLKKRFQEAGLVEREKEVLSLRFGLDGREPLTLIETASRLRMGKEWVRQLQNRALTKLRDAAG